MEEGNISSPHSLSLSGVEGASFSRRSQLAAPRSKSHLDGGGLALSLSNALRHERAERERESDVIREVSNDGKGKAPSIPHSSFSALAPSTKTLSALLLPTPTLHTENHCPFPFSGGVQFGQSQDKCFRRRRRSTREEN